MKRFVKLSIIGMALTFGGIVALSACSGNSGYTVSFKGPNGEDYGSQSVEWGKQVDLPTDKTKTGHHFVGWYEDAALTIAYVPKPVETDLTLYARFDRNSYTVTFDSVGGSEVAPITNLYQEIITCPTPTKDSYTFSGWFLEEDYKTSYDNRIPAKDLTVYAKWAPNSYTITFDSNSNGEATGVMNTQSMSIDDTELGRTLRKNLYQWKGHTFVCWSLEEDGSGALFQDEAVVSYIEKTENITLYAQWSLNEYNVSFYKDETLLSTTPVSYGEKIEFPEDNPSKVGYDFLGWGLPVLTEDKEIDPSKDYFASKSEGGFVLAVPTKETLSSLYEMIPQEEIVTLDRDMSVYACFKKVEQTLSYYDGDTLLDSVSCYVNDKITLMDIPEKTGCTPTNWFFDKELTSRCDTLTISDSDVDLYAGYSLNDYVFSFKGDYSTQRVTAHYGDDISSKLPADPSKVGYTFKGWAIEGTETVVEIPTVMPAENRNYVPVFQVNRLTITFDTDGGSQVKPIEADFGSRISAPSYPTKEGYRFLGWFIEGSDEPVDVPETMPATSMTLKAHWEVLPFYVRFDLNGGEGTTVKQVNFGEFVIAPTEPNKVGYIFAHWADENGDEFVFGNKMPAHDISLKAIWTPGQVNITVDYYKQNLDGSFSKFGSEILNATTEGSFTVSKAVADQYLAASEEPEKAGLTYLSSEEIAKVAPTGGTVAVKYSRNQYKVTITNSLDTTKEELTYKYNQELGDILSSRAKDGYTHVAQVDGADVDATYEVISNVTVNIVYTANTNSVVFNANGGSFNGQSSLTIDFDFGEPIVVPTGADLPTREGYTFAGWFTKNGADGDWGEDFTTAHPTMPNNGLNAYAKWDINSYKITFNTVGGSVIEEQTYEFGASISAPTNPTKAGYEFVKWLEEGDVDFFSQHATMPSHNVTLTAVYNPYTLTITYNGNGQTSGEMTSSNYSYDQLPVKQDDPVLVLTENAFEKTGYHFAGWSLTPGGVKAFSDGDAITPSLFTKVGTELNLYAIWEYNDYKLSFDLNGGTSEKIDPIEKLHYGDNIEELIPDKPTRENYHFVGWFNKADNTKFLFTTMENNDVELYAKWEQNSYNIHFIYNTGDSSHDVTYEELVLAGSDLNDDMLPQGQTPSIHGYVFKGWTEINGDKDDKHLINSLDGHTMPDYELVLYARWDAAEYMIEFFYAYEQGGTKIGEARFHYDSEIIYDAPVVAGKIFYHWEDEKGKIVITVNDLVDGEAINNKLIAIYIDTTTIKYIVGGEEIYSTDDSSKNFVSGYIQSLLDERNKYDEVYEMIAKSAGGDTGEFTVFVTYATLSTTSRNDLILLGISTVVGENPEMIGRIISKFSSEEEVAYLYLISTITPDTIEDVMDQISKNYMGKPTFNYMMDLATAAQGGDFTELSGVVAYCKSVLMNDNQLHQDFFVQAVASSVGGKDVASAIFMQFDAKFPAKEYSAYLKMVADNGAEGIDDTASATSALATEYGTKYINYKKHAYVPFVEDDSKIFNGWNISQDTSKNIIYTADFVPRCEHYVTNLDTTNTTTSSATFGWDKIAGSYAYRVEIYSLDKEEPTLLTRVVITDNTFTYNGLLSNQTLRVDVSALSMTSGTGIIREASKVFTAKDLEDDTNELSFGPIDLAGETNSINYTHSGSSDIKRITSAGDFYYLDKDQKIFYMFCSTSYSFSGKKIQLDKGGFGVEIKDGGYTLATSPTPTGDDDFIKFTVYEADPIDGTTYTAHIYPLPERLNYSDSLDKFMKTELTSTISKEEAKGKFLAPDNETIFYVGKSGAKGSNIESISEFTFTDTDTNISYNNGIKLAMKPISSNGQQIARFPKEATVTYLDEGSNEVSLPQGSFYYDSDRDLIFFKTDVGEGFYTITIAPKSDAETTESGQGANVYVPKKYKEDLSKLTKSFTVYVNDGLNVYSNEQLKQAFADLKLSNVNVMNDIKAQYTPNQVAPIDHLIANGQSGKLIPGAADSRHGEVDIKPLSAVMSEKVNSSYTSPKHWSSGHATGGETEFQAKDGTWYHYTASGTYAIESCEWVENRTTGRFKIIDNFDWRMTKKVAGYSVSDIYLRNGTGDAANPNAPLTINGNYFDIDASENPFTMTPEGVSVGDVTARYQVQLVYGSIFANEGESTLTINNANVMGNTENTSAYLPTEEGKEAGIKEIMERCSGGLNGISSRYSCNKDPYVQNRENLDADRYWMFVRDNNYGKVVTNSVNVSDTLIALYSDGAFDISYTNASNSWANGLYAYQANAYTLNIDHTIIQSSGGAALHVEDHLYNDLYNSATDFYDKTFNPTINIDYSSTVIENLVSGAEQWFKAYTMELIALGLKSQIDQQVSPMGKTVIVKDYDPVTGLPSDKFNWVYFNQNLVANVDRPVDLGANLLQNYTDVNIATEFGFVFVNNEDLAALQKGEATVLRGIIYTPVDDVAPQATGGYYFNQTFVFTEVTLNPHTFELLSQGKSYLNFRMSYPKMGYIGGIIELFNK